MGNFKVVVYEMNEDQAAQNYGLTQLSVGSSTIEVYLNTDVSPALYNETFWHEMGHVFEMAFGVHISHHTVSNLGVGFAQLMGSLNWIKQPKKSSRNLKPRIR